jgi:outer membrane protein OmpA-like peptidoglycan-associated protein
MMNMFTTVVKMATAGAALLALTACMSAPPKPLGADLVREKLTRLQADPQLATRAPVEIRDAEKAVSSAEQPESDTVIANHRVLLADRTVDIATARAQSRLLVDERKQLSQQSDQVRLDARTREADLAHNDATAARMDADSARADASTARQEAITSRNDADEAKLQAVELQNQIAILNARETDRGLVVTLGDVLFATDKSDLMDGAADNLNKLVAFLDKYEDRSLTIEGYTDNVGLADYNLALSQRRADSVKSYMVRHGIDSSRLSAYGRGEDSPVSNNDTSVGRQMNRRVEIIISNSIALAT